MFLKYLDIAALCIASGIMIYSFSITSELYEIYAFVAVSAGLAWTGCLLVNGAPARWYTITTFKIWFYITTGYCMLLVFISLVGLIPVVVNSMYELVPVVVASNIILFRVFVPTCIILVHKLRNRPEILNI